MVDGGGGAAQLAAAGGARREFYGTYDAALGTHLVFEQTVAAATPAAPAAAAAAPAAAVPVADSTDAESAAPARASTPVGFVGGDDKPAFAIHERDLMPQAPRAPTPARPELHLRYLVSKTLRFK